MDDDALLSHSNLTDKVYEEIKKRIMSRQLTPGQRLKYEEIGKAWKISITPWREAMARLTKEGLVQAIPRGGVYVKRYSRQEIAEIYDIREALEGFAIQTAAASASSRELELLRKSIAAFAASVKKREMSACLQNDFHFHHLLVKLSGNEKLKEMLSTFHIQIASISETGLRYFKHARSYVEDHGAIVDALEGGDAQEAIKRLCSHIRRGKELVLAAYLE